MGAKIFISPGQIISQADFEANQNENGGWEGKQSFKVAKGELENITTQLFFSAGRPITEMDPDADSLWSFLKLRKSSIGTELGGYTLISCDFQGFVTSAGSSASPDEEAPTYSLRGVSVDAPINEHPKWKDLSDTDKIRLGYLMDGTYKLNSSQKLGAVGDDGAFTEFGTENQLEADDAKEFAERIAQGRLTYKFGSYSYAKRWNSNEGLTEAQLNKLGKIANPPGNPPTPGAGRDWILETANQEQVGSVDALYTNEIVFLLSDEGGHDEFLQGD